MDYFIKKAALSKLASLRLAINYILRCRLEKSAGWRSRWGTCAPSYNTNAYGCSTASSLTPPPAPTLKNPKSILENNMQPTPATPPTNNKVVMHPVSPTITNTNSLPPQPASPTQTQTVTTPVNNSQTVQSTQPKAVAQPPKTNVPPEPQLQLPGIEDRILSSLPTNMNNPYGEEPDYNNPSWNTRKTYFDNSYKPSARTYYDSLQVDDPGFATTPAHIPVDADARSIPLVGTSTGNIQRNNNTIGKSTFNNIASYADWATPIISTMYPAIGPVISSANLMWKSRNKLRPTNGSWFNFNDVDEDLNNSLDE